MNKLHITLLITILLLTVGTIAELDTESDCVLYFYGTDCNHCEGPTEMLRKLEIKYPNLHVQRFNVYESAEHKNLLEAYFTSYNIPKDSQGLPVILIGDTYFSGDRAIQELVEHYLLSGDHYDCPEPKAKQVIGVAGAASPLNNFESLPYSMIFKSAIKDSLSPFLLAMFLILLGLIGSLKDGEELRRRSMYYILGAFVLYILFTFTVVDGFTPDGAPKYFTKLIGLIAIFAGIYVIRNFVLGKKGLVAQLSKPSKKRFQHRLGLILSDIGFMLVGFVAAIFTIPTTSTVLPVLRSLYLEPTWALKLVPMLLFYLIVLSVPMIILALIIYLTRYYFEYTGEIRGGGSERRIEIWQRHHVRLFRLFVSLVGIFIGLYVLLAHI